MRKNPFENIVEKGENAGNQQCFLPFPVPNFNFLSKFILLPANAFNLD